MAITLLWLLAAMHVLYTASCVINYSMAHPFLDQFRLNLRYLTIPFPLSIFEIENGHRPVLPGFVRWLELRFFHGNSWLEFGTAWGLAIASLLFLLREIGRATTGLLFAMAASTVCVLLLWNANARMFVHSYEAQHVFYVSAALMFALSRIAAGQRVSGANLALALLACIAATFSFGPGIATFAAVFFVVAARRGSISHLAITAVVAVLAFASYSYWLPGSEAVSGAGAKASPLAILWFAFARFSAVFFDLFKPALRDETLRGYLSIAVSAPIVGLTVWVIVRDWMHGKVPDKLGLVGLGFFAFAGVTNTLIAVSRSAYFAEYPGQLYAERYLYWACCLWAGLAMYWADRRKTSTNRAMGWLSVTLMLIFLLALVQATWWRSWSAAVYRSIERATVGIQLGIYDEKRLLDISEPSLDLTRQSIDAMRQAGVSIFAPPFENLLGQMVVIPANQIKAPEVWVAFERTVVQSPREKDVAVIFGALPKVIAKSMRAGAYWLADSSGKVVGRCALSGASQKGANLWRYISPTFDEIDCYTIDAGAAPLYFVMVRDGTATVAARLMFY